MDKSQESRVALFKKVLARQFQEFLQLKDGKSHLLLELKSVNLVFFQGRLYICKQGEGLFAPNENSLGYTSATEVWGALRGHVEPQELPEEYISKGRIHLFSMIGMPTRMHAYYRQLNDGQPRLLLDLMGYNLVLFQDRIFLNVQGATAIVPHSSHVGYASVMEACAALFEALDHDCFPEIQAFGHRIIKREDGIYHTDSIDGSLESDSLASLMLDLKKRRDAHLQIYIHTGMPKTATTFLQRRVFPNIPGVHFVAWDTYFFAHQFQRIKYGCPFSFIEEIREGFNRYLDSFDEDKVLISDEIITGPGFRAKGVGSAAIVLGEVFPQARILLVLREQLSQLRSFYLQQLRAGMNRSAVNFVRYDKKIKDFIDFDLDIDNNHIDMKYFEYKALIQLLRSRFSSVHVLLFEQLKYTPQLFAAGLSDWLQEPLNLDGESRTRENVGLGMLGVAIFKLFNWITAGREWVWHESRIAWFVSWVNRMDAKFHISYEPFPLWLRSAILQRYAGTNRELGGMIELDVEYYWNKLGKGTHKYEK